jgi:predicted nucleotidyltransferase
MGDISDALKAYSLKREETFARVVDKLLADERIRAAWLSGAHGRGEDDEWSDFDLCLAIRDDYFEPIRADPTPLISLAGEVLLVQANFASDSIPGGHFWLVMYPGPMHIDWNVGPISLATRPRASKLLFEKEPVPVAADPSPMRGDEARDLAQKALELFWAMAPIAVKYAGRGWTRRAIHQEALLSSAFERLWRLAHGLVLRTQDEYSQNRPPDAAMRAAAPAFGPQIDPAAALDAILGYCAAVEALHPRLAALGVIAPDRMHAEVRRLAEIARSESQRGVVRPGSGSRR